MFKRLFSTGKKVSEYSVFVLDNDASIVQMIVAALQGEGYQVHSTTSGSAAITMLDQIPLPDMFILDLRMPDMDGREFLETIRTRFGQAALPPVLLLSGAKEGEATANLMQVQDYLPKPFESQNLLEHVWQLIEKKEQKQ